MQDSNNKKQDEEIKYNKDEDTKYGEFVCSYFSWITLSDQKQRAEEMSNMTKKDIKKKL